MALCDLSMGVPVSRSKILCPSIMDALLVFLAEGGKCAPNGNGGTEAKISMSWAIVRT